MGSATRAIFDSRLAAELVSGPATTVDLMKNGETDAVFLRAAEAILSRGWGRPMDLIEDRPPPPRLSLNANRRERLSVDELALLLDLQDKMLGKR